MGQIKLCEELRLSMIDDMRFDLEQIHSLQRMDKFHYYEPEWKPMTTQIYLIGKHLYRVLENYKSLYTQPIPYRLEREVIRECKKLKLL